MSDSPCSTVRSTERVLSRAEVLAWEPDGPPLGREAALEAALRSAGDTGCRVPGQQLGERWPVGCIALEITQRCNLDCTLCYLSEHSEAVLDLPLAAVFRRIDLIREHYGTGVDVQVTGGDPTLRRRDELVSIVRRLADQGQRPTLMTNGIRASRELLAELAGAGLHDVAFHVDTTQERKGFADEASLHAVRRSYIDNARGLGLSVMFNTTVHHENIDAVPGLVEFFVANADVVRTASFQIQADTGRGVLRGRPDAVSMDAVWGGIERGAHTTLDGGASLVGDPRCTRYGLGLVANGRVFDALAERDLIARIQAATAHISFDRRRRGRTIGRFTAWLARHPREALACLGWAARRVRAMGSDLVAARGRAHTISFMVHDFMHACTLVEGRIHACAFKVMTERGPLSMCMHNARRDEFILAPVAMPDQGHWGPLDGERSEVAVAVAPPDPESHGLKRARGTTRRRLRTAREAASK